MTGFRKLLNDVVIVRYKLRLTARSKTILLHRFRENEDLLQQTCDVFGQTVNVMQSRLTSRSQGHVFFIYKGQLHYRLPAYTNTHT